MNQKKALIKLMLQKMNMNEQAHTHTDTHSLAGFNKTNSLEFGIYFKQKKTKIQVIDEFKLPAHMPYEEVLAYFLIFVYFFYSKCHSDMINKAVNSFGRTREAQA